jgi:hypothetical protein
MMHTKIRRAIIAVVSCAWFAAMAALFVIDSTYVGYPKVPNPEIGRIVPYTVKNVIVYLTKDEETIAKLVHWSAFGFGSLAVICMLVNQKWPLPPDK